MTVSTIPAVKAYLVSAITGSSLVTGDPSIQVCYDDPEAGAQANDIISVGKVRQNLGVAAMVGGGGAGWLEERYQVEIVATSYDGGNDAQTAMERCCTIIAAVVDVIRADPSCGGRVIEARPTDAEYEIQWSEEGGGRFAVGALTVQVSAII